GFTRHRIGLSVLHPQSVHGSQVEGTGPDAKVVETEWPRLLSRHQALRSIRAMECRVADTATAAAFESDTLETEAQRSLLFAHDKSFINRVQVIQCDLVPALREILHGLRLTERESVATFDQLG